MLGLKKAIPSQEMNITIYKKMIINFQCKTIIKNNKYNHLKKKLRKTSIKLYSVPQTQ